MQNSEKSIVLEYTPSDFFYLSAAGETPDNNLCSVFEYEKINEKCENGTETDMLKCYRNELCKNRQLVEQLNSTQNIHSSLSIQYVDYETKYNNEVLKTMNLLIGTIATITYIYYNR